MDNSNEVVFENGNQFRTRTQYRPARHGHFLLDLPWHCKVNLPRNASSFSAIQFHTQISVSIDRRQLEWASPTQSVRNPSHYVNCEHHRSGRSEKIILFAVKPISRPSSSRMPFMPRCWRSSITTPLVEVFSPELTALIPFCEDQCKHSRSEFERGGVDEHCSEHQWMNRVRDCDPRRGENKLRILCLMCHPGRLDHDTSNVIGSASRA
jgi:hypothetical protein